MFNVQDFRDNWPRLVRLFYVLLVTSCVHLVPTYVRARPFVIHPPASPMVDDTRCHSIGHVKPHAPPNLRFCPVVVLFLYCFLAISARRS